MTFVFLQCYNVKSMQLNLGSYEYTLASHSCKWSFMGMYGTNLSVHLTTTWMSTLFFVLFPLCPAAADLSFTLITHHALMSVANCDH